jgi:hypothetical protein
MEEERKAYKVLAEKPEGKKPLGRARCRWENGIRMDLKEIGWGCGVKLTGSGWRSVKGCCEWGDEPLGSNAKKSVMTHRGIECVTSEEMEYNLSMCCVTL